jgi:hypothetical protein
MGCDYQYLHRKLPVGFLDLREAQVFLIILQWPL